MTKIALISLKTVIAIPFFYKKIKIIFFIAVIADFEKIAMNVLFNISLIQVLLCDYTGLRK